MSYHGFYDYDEYLDAKLEAEKDAYYDLVDAEGWTCSECGEMWDPQWVPATRMQPSEVRVDSCPNCGGGPVTDDTGCVITGRTREDD